MQLRSMQLNWLISKQNGLRGRMRRRVSARRIVSLGSQNIPEDWLNPQKFQVHKCFAQRLNQTMPMRDCTAQNYLHVYFFLKSYNITVLTSAESKNTFFLEVHVSKCVLNLPPKF